MCHSEKCYKIKLKQWLSNIEIISLVALKWKNALLCFVYHSSILFYSFWHITVSTSLYDFIVIVVGVFFYVPCITMEINTHTHYIITIMVLQRHIIWFNRREIPLAREQEKSTDVCMCTCGMFTSWRKKKQKKYWTG